MGFSPRNLSVLSASEADLVVNHRGTKNTEIAQRKTQTRLIQGQQSKSLSDKLKLIGQLLDLVISKTGRIVIVHQADSLHERIADS